MRAHYANPTHPCTSVRWQVADNSFPICPWTYRVFTGVLLGGGVIEGLIGTQEILSTREKTQTQAREFNDFNAHRARDSINTDQELHWNNAAASLNGNAFIIPSKNREQQNNALKKMKTKTSFKHHKYTSLLCVYDKLCA